MSANPQDRRLEPRMLCADLVQTEWTDRSGHQRKGHGNLEDISLSGACVQVERPVPAGTVIRLSSEEINLSGVVRYCVFRDTGYFLGIRFEPGTKWDRRQFRPRHMFDPRRLVVATLRRRLKETVEPAVEETAAESEAR